MRFCLLLLSLCFLVYSASAQVGNPDSAFNATGIVKSGVSGTRYNSIVIQPDGKILIGGGNELVRYNTNGTLDASFGTGGRRTTSYPVIAIALQGDGKIIVGSSDGFRLLRYTTAGKLDSTFGVNGIRSISFDDNSYDATDFDPGLTSIAVQPDGKIVALGSDVIWRKYVSNFDFEYFDPYIIGRTFALARFTADGLLDMTFGGDGRYTYDTNYDPYNEIFDYYDVTALALQQDRKIVVAGSKDGNFWVARYNTNGTLDASFSGDGIQTSDFAGKDSAYALAIQPDGKIIVSGTKDDDFATARFLSNGNPDLSFDVDSRKTTEFSSLTFDRINSVTIQSDGKIVVGGTTGARFALARYNTNGSLDLGFSGDGQQTTDINNGSDKISAIAISGNRLYVAGTAITSTNVTNGVVGAYKLGNLPSTASAKVIKVNVHGGTGAYSNTEWNNWNVTSSLNSGALKFANGATSTVSATLSATYSIIDNGSNYGGYMAPPQVLRFGSTGTSARTLTFNGLLTNKKYSLELYATRANTGNSTRFTINGNTVTILTDQNKTDKASFINLVPNASGQLIVSIANVKTYNYVNGFILTEQSGTCPGPEVTPLYPLKGQLCNGTAITLRASGGTSYQWYRANGSIIAGQTGPTYLVNADSAGIYTVRAFNGTCASGMSEYAALEGPLVSPSQPPGPIGTPPEEALFHCGPINVGIVSTVGQKYTFLRNGAVAAGPVDGSGNPISYSFTSTTSTRVLRVASSTISATANTLRTASVQKAAADSEYTIQPTYYSVITTKPGCSDTIVYSNTFKIYHVQPLEGLTRTSLTSTTASFTWKPLCPGARYQYEVVDIEANAIIVSESTDYETTGQLIAPISTLVPGKNYKFSVYAYDPTPDGGCQTGALTLEFTTPSSVPTITTFQPSSGAVGVGVMIRGTSFTNVSAVRFNGVTATEIYVASPTRLYATVPLGATTGKIQVQNSNGTVTSAGTFTVAAVVSKWEGRAGLATARLQHGTIATGGKIYVFGGRNSAGLLTSLEIYNPATNTWSAGAPMPVAIRGMATALGSDGNIYMFGGATSTQTTASAYKYSPTTNTWTAIATMPDAVFEPAAASTSNGKIYLFGGEPVFAKTTSTNATRIYDIATNTWSTGAPMPVGVQQHSAITIDNYNIYVIGGRAFEAKEPLGLIQIYNPASDYWKWSSPGAAMLIPKVQFGAVKARDGRIYVVGGKAPEPNNIGPFFHTVEAFTPLLYDYITNSWESEPVLPKAIGQQTAVELNGYLYAIGGSDGTYRNHVYRLKQPPLAPTDLRATTISSSQVNLSWKDNSNDETSFVVERSTDRQGPFSPIASLGSNISTYANTGLSANTDYYYRIKATNAGGNSLYSNVDFAYTGSEFLRKASDGNAGSTEVKAVVPNRLQVTPNPARGVANLRFSVNKEQRVQLAIYDTRGNLVRQLFNGTAEEGKTYQVQWDTGSTTPGLYLGSLLSAEGVITEKIMLLPE